MSDTIKARIELTLLFILFIFIAPRIGMQFDMQMWTRWALYIHQHGLTNAYNDPAVTYHPVYLYILYVYGLLQGSDAMIVQHMYCLKYFTLLFDFLPVIVLCCFRQNLIKEKIPYLFLVLNIAYLFNTLVWGQIDSIHTNLIFLALLAAFYRPALSVMLYALAFTTKLQAIVFLPILIILLIYGIKNLKQLVGVILIGIITELLLVAPFLLAGKIHQVIYVGTHLMDYYHSVSIGAFNLWYLFLHDPYHTNDFSTFCILTYKQTGLLLFLLFSCFTLLPLFMRVLRLKITKENIERDTLQLMMLASGMIALYFFYFNTQMHERYAHPIIIFFFFYAVLSKRYALYILASIPYLLSLDKCFPDFLPVVHYKIIFASKVIAIWYTIALLYGLYEFFRQYSIRKEYAELRRPVAAKFPGT